MTRGGGPAVVRLAEGAALVVVTALARRVLGRLGIG